MSAIYRQKVSRWKHAWKLAKSTKIFQTVQNVGQCRMHSGSGEGVEFCILDSQEAVDWVKPKLLEQKVEAFSLVTKMNNWIAHKTKG